MPTPEYDLRYWEAALDELEAYLPSPELFWNLDVSPPPGEPAYPPLTVGNLLLARQRLQRPLPPELEARRQSLEQRLQAFIAQWRANWRQKAAKELEMRARLWAQYMDECAQSQAEAAFYSTEVRNRVLADLLMHEGEAELPAAEELVAYADTRLRARFEPGPFVWEEDLIPAFPKERFWYLYGRPAHCG